MLIYAGVSSKPNTVASSPPKKPRKAVPFQTPANTSVRTPAALGEEAKADEPDQNSADQESSRRGRRGRTTKPRGGLTTTINSEAKMEAFHSELQGMVDGAIAVEDEQLGAQNSPDPAVNTAAGAQYSFVESEAEEENEEENEEEDYSENEEDNEEEDYPDAQLKDAEEADEPDQEAGPSTSQAITTGGSFVGLARKPHQLMRFDLISRHRE